MEKAIPFFPAFRSINRGRGPKYTVPCPKGRPRRTRRQGEDAERRRAQKDISGPAVHADGGTGGRHSPLLSDGGMVGQRRPGDVYKMRLQIGVHNGAFCCSGTLMKRRKFNGGKRCRLAFHAVDRGSNPLGDAKIRYNEGYRCAKHIGILSFFVSTGFPVVHVCPVASNSCKGISEGRSMLCKSVIPSRITGLYCCIFCPERYRNIQHKPGSTPCLLPTFVSAV